MILDTVVENSPRIEGGENEVQIESRQTRSQELSKKEAIRALHVQLSQLSVDVSGELDRQWEFVAPVERELDQFIRDVVDANDENTIDNHGLTNRLESSCNYSSMDSRELDALDSDLLKLSASVRLARLSQANSAISAADVMQESEKLNVEISREIQAIFDLNDTAEKCRNAAIPRGAVFAVFAQTAKMLGRNTEEAVLADARAAVYKILQNSQIDPFETKRGRGAVSPIAWIRSVIAPKLDPDLQKISEDLNVYSWLNPRAGKGPRTSLYQALLNHHSRKKPSQTPRR
jgi:hypothetical protein